MAQGKILVLRDLLTFGQEQSDADTPTNLEDLPFVR